jgi:hypothetical protein
MPSTQITNPRGAFGQTTTGYARTVDSFKTTAAVVAKRVVAVGTTGQTVATAATNGTASLAIGVALDAAASGDTVLVATQGVVTGVPVDGATAAGTTLIRSGTTAGSLAASATPALGEAFAISLVASASNTTTVWIL